MALNLSIKNVPEALADKLKLRAEANHRSLQGELMAMIESSVRAQDAEPNTSVSSAPRNTALAKRVSESKAQTNEKLTLRDIAERMRSRFPSPVTMPAGMSAVELVRQMRDGRDGTQWRDTGHQDKGF